MRGPLAKRRDGFSLMEVLVATGMLATGLAMVAQLATIGRKHLQKAETATEALAHCENLLVELELGMRSLEAVDEQPFEPTGLWQHTLTVQPSVRPEYSEVAVSVRPASPTDAAGTADSTGGKWYTLRRWIRIPALGDPGATGSKSGPIQNSSIQFPTR